MRLRWVSVLSLALVGLFGAGVGTARYLADKRLLVTGKAITPQGAQTEVGSHPINMILSPDGNYVLVTNCGFREQLSVLDAKTGALISSTTFEASKKGAAQGLYYGLAATVTDDGKTIIAASRGAEDLISLYDLKDGKLTHLEDVALAKSDNPLKISRHVAGLQFGPNADTLYVVCNQSHAFNKFKGSVAIIDRKLKSEKVVNIASFPLAMEVVANRLFVTAEGGDSVEVIDTDTLKVESIRTGVGPVGLALDTFKKHLYVTNSMSDTLSVVNTANLKVEKTVLLRPGHLRGFPGSTPTGVTVTPDGKTVFVAMSDLNAVAIYNAEADRVEGYLPTGWDPTSVLVTKDGQRLFVANAKGVQERNPNNQTVRDWGQYAPNILEGTVSVTDVYSAKTNVKESTLAVLKNNGQTSIDDQKSFVNPGIEHVIYVVKENRTYDQVLGDMERGNGDPKLTLFGKDITPNQHALADRFALLDNFYVCAEVSADGWNWSTSGMTNAYANRNVPYNYSGRGRNYDFEGTVNGSAVDLDDQRDVATAAGGYLWDQCLKQNISFRNYGMFTAFGSKETGPDGKPLAEDNAPDKKALVGKTCLDFRRYDLAYADSDAWVKHDLPPAPVQLTGYGRLHEPSRMSVWLREFNEQVSKKSFPKMTFLRLGRDHTSGTQKGQYTPQACVADNDYAVGQLVEAVSKSPYWKTTAIFVLEDDAQAGYDHVDCHRSTAYVISPWIEKNRLDSRFYNTDSVLRTMSVLLGIKPINQYVATAPLMNIFTSKPGNEEPYSAILPSKAIIGAINGAKAYRSKDSEQLISRFEEESKADIELNDILWHSIKGVSQPLPTIQQGIWSRTIKR